MIFFLIRLVVADKKIITYFDLKLNDTNYFLLEYLYSE